MTKPSKNTVTGEYTNDHKGYDFSGRGDSNIYACLAGNVVQSVNLYNTSWQSTPPLTTKDYGNFIKLKHDDGTFSLYAHLKKDSLLPVGTRVVEGQRIATVGNTGNSNGTHLHFEYRNASNVNIKPIFEEAGMSDEYGNLVWKSTQHDETVKALFEPNKDPRQTSSGDVLSVVNGYKAQATDMRNKLSTADSEINNRREQVGRLEKQLLDSESLRKAEASFYSESAKATAKMKGEYEGRLGSLQDQVDEFARTKGELSNEIARLSAENNELKKQSTSPLTLADVVKLIIPKIWKALSSISLRS